MKSKKIKSTQYLYDCDPKDLKDLKYIEALEYKEMLTNKLMKKLAKEAREKGATDEDMLTRYLDVLDARDFNRQLLKEMK